MLLKVCRLFLHFNRFLNVCIHVPQSKNAVIVLRDRYILLDISLALQPLFLEGKGWETPDVCRREHQTHSSGSPKLIENVSLSTGLLCYLCALKLLATCFEIL